MATKKTSNKKQQQQRRVDPEIEITHAPEKKVKSKPTAKNLPAKVE